MRISVLTVVYNEAQILPFMLEGVIDSTDELVIVNGGPDGVSTDATGDIIKRFQHIYGDKIISMEGAFRRDDVPVWDEGAARRVSLEASHGDYLFIIDGDEVFNLKDFAKVVHYARHHPGYSIRVSCVSFFPDTDRVEIVMHDSAGLTIATRVIGYPRYGDSHYLDNVQRREPVSNTPYQEMLLPDMPLYNYSWARGYGRQAERHIYHVKLGYWGIELKEAEEIDQYKWVVEHINSCEGNPNVRPAVCRPGHVPTKFFASMFDGKDEYLKKLEGHFHGDWLSI